MMHSEATGFFFPPKGMSVCEEQTAALLREQYCYCSAWKGISHCKALKFQQRIPTGGWEYLCPQQVAEWAGSSKWPNAWKGQVAGVTDSSTGLNCLCSINPGKNPRGLFLSPTTYQTRNAGIGTVNCRSLYCWSIPRAWHSENQDCQMHLQYLNK